MTDDDLTRLVERVRRLEDERSILDTLHQYGHTIDYGHRDDWLDCFATGAVYEVRLRGVVRLRCEDTEALREFIGGHSSAPERWHKHLLVEPRITVAADEARATSYFVRLDEGADVLTVHAFGRYLDRLRPSPDGRWRFIERIVEVEAIDVPGPMLAGP